MMIEILLAMRCSGRALGCAVFVLQEEDIEGNNRPTTPYANAMMPQVQAEGH